MSTAQQKTQQQPTAAAASMSSGTGSSSSTRFRRQKIVPSVVARKIGANSSNPKSSAKVAPLMESSKEASSHDDESKQAATKEKLVAEMPTNLQHATTQPIEAPSSSQADEAHKVVEKDDLRPEEVATSSPKPPTTAFRRIKPKVAIPQTQKPAKSILKKSTTPVKEQTTATVQVEYVLREGSKLTVQESSGAPVETVSHQHDPVSEGSEAQKQQSFPDDQNQHASFSPTQCAHYSNIKPSIEQTLHARTKAPFLLEIDRMLSQSPENDINQSTRMVVEQSKSLSSKNSALAPTNNLPSLPVPSASVVSVVKVSLAPMAENIVNSPANTEIAAKKIIKKTYKLGDNAPQIADLLKASFGKKMGTGKRRQTNGKVVAAVSKTPDLNEKLENASLSSNTSHANEETKPTQMVVERNKASAEDGAASPVATDKIPIPKMRNDSIPSVSALPITKDSRASLPENIIRVMPPITTIERKGMVSNCSVQIAERTKGSIGKKTTSGIQTPTNENIAAASFSPDTSHENETNVQVEYVPKESSKLTMQESSGDTVDTGLHQHDPVSEESLAQKLQSFPNDQNQHTHNLTKDANVSFNITHCSQYSNVIPTNVQTPHARKQADLFHKIDHMLSRSPENAKNQSIRMAVEQSKSPSSENSALAPTNNLPSLPVPSASVVAVAKVSLAPMAENIVNSPANTEIAAKKIIKKTYKLGDNAPQIADLLKASFGKKMGTGKRRQTNGKVVAAVSKPPDLNEKLENASLSSNTSHANEETKPTQMVVDRNKAPAEDGAASPVPVQEMRLDNISPKETIVTVAEEAAAGNVPLLETVTKPSPSPGVNPQPPPTAPAENVPIIGGQISRGKQIQKIRKLTPEQWQQALNSLKKGKAKTVASSTKTTKASNNGTAPSPQATVAESTPTVSQNEPPIVMPVVVPTPPAKPSVSMHESRTVNIISDIVLPPLNVFHGPVSRSTNVHGSSTVPRVITQPNIFSVSEDAVAINIPTTPPRTTSTAATSNVPTVDSDQYPKLIILHQPAPALASPSTGPSSGGLKLAQHSLSVTILPSSTVQRARHPPVVPSSQKRPLSLPTPEVTVRQTAAKQTPYANAAPIALPTPIISVTVTPATNDKGSNCSPVNSIDVPVGTRIVPKIVIDDCDTADHDDSQASHSSTSSSSSSGQISTPKQQPKNRSDFCTPTRAKDCSATTVMGCSPDIREKLRAKIERNSRKKEKGESSGKLPRQYAGPSGKRQQGNHDANVLEHTLTAVGVKPGGSNTVVDPPKTEWSIESKVALPIAPTIAPLTALAGQSDTTAAAPSSGDRPEPGTDVPNRGRERTAAIKSKQAEAHELNVSKNCAEKARVGSSLHNDPQNEPLVKSGIYGGDVLAGSTVAPETKITNASVANLVCEEKKDRESNEFFGFSSASIEHTERDFEDRARTIDLMLAKGTSSEEGTRKKEETSEQPLSPMKKVTVELDSEPAATSVPVAESVDRRGSGSTREDESFKRTESTETVVSAVPDKTNNTQQIEEPRVHVGTDVNLPELGPETSLNDSVVIVSEKLQENVDTSINLAEVALETALNEGGMMVSEKPQQNVGTDVNLTDGLKQSGIMVSEKPQANVGINVNLTELGPETALNESGMMISEKPERNVGSDVNLAEVAPETSLNDSVVVISDSDETVENEHENDSSKPAAEAKDFSENAKLAGDLEATDPGLQKSDLSVEENGLTLPVIHQALTGVDLIIAEAALRRQQRIISVDDTSDKEYEHQPVTNLPTATPSTSSRCDGPLKNIKKPDMRKRRRDKLINLLWKHVDVEALVDDLVKQKNQSSLDEKSLGLGSESESESDKLTPSSDESLVEVPILNAIRDKVRAAFSSAVVDGVAERSADCGQQPTAQHDQRDEVKPSSTFICDKPTEASNEPVPNCASLPARSVVPVAQSNEPSASEPITIVCDKSETNVATCDTSSSAVAELSNTHTEQVQLAPVSRKRQLAPSTKHFAKRKAPVQKRPKLSRTGPIGMTLARFDSSDRSGNEVVSDCSSDGLSTVEVTNGSKKPAAYKSVADKLLPSDSKEEPGRSRISRRRYSSSSSNSNSSTAGNSASLSREGRPSARDGSKSGKRRKLRRRTKRTERRTTIVATVDCNVSPSTSTTSNLDAQYVIPEVAEQSETAAAGAAKPRAIDISKVKSNRILKAADPGKAEVPKRGRGRAAAVTKPKQAEARELNVSKDSAVNERVSSALNDDPDDEPLVKCGNCGGDVVAAAWEDHANYHNGAAYRVGVDATLDMKDVKAISTAILRFMKIHNRKELACERCGMVKKSGVGMASHYISCGLSELELEQTKAACVHCGRKMKAVSLLVHQQQHCRVLKEQQRQIVLSERDDAAAADKDTLASGRKKRKSVASAERMIKKMSKEINEDTVRELIMEVTGHGVSNAIMQCWLAHLKQSDEAVCSSKGCPFFGMTSEHMRREHSDKAGSGQKPLYQCAKCTYMSTSQDGIKTHLTTDHPQLIRSHLTSGSDSDVYTAYKDGSTTDDYDNFALEDEDEGNGSKGGKGKKSKSKAKKAPSKAGSKAISTEVLLDSSMVSAGTEETDVYKEMVLQESIEFKQDKFKYHIMSAKWTQEFRREHYVARLLFSDLRPDMDTSYLRSITNLQDYLPQATHSMRYVQCNSGQYEPGYTAEKFIHRWQQKVTFEGEALGCESMFFCGGPVVSLDWLPLPDEAGNDCDQFLAVACKQRYDEYYNCKQLAVPRSHKSLVQIWNVGPIQNIGSTKVTLRCPRLAFAIACDYGPIWQVAFCPSGCYNDPTQEGDDLDRLGLLAVAGSDGDVHLYALSRSMAGTETDTLPRILPLRSVLLLSLSCSVESHNEPASDFTGRSVQRIAWSREKGHNVLAAGYSNGVVAVWNLSVKSSLLAGTKNGIRTLLPVRKFLHSSSSCITALDLHYSSGSRFLVVCNADRRLKVYDLGPGLYQPPETLSMVVRSRISAIRWMLNFPVLVIAYDDALYIDRCAYSVHQPRDIGLRMFNIFTVGSEMTDLGTNDWYSMNAVATSGGDLVGHRSVPFVHGMNYKKLPQILTTTIPLKLNAIDDSVDVSYYGAFAKEYGLLFSDTDKVPTAMDTTALHLKTWRRAKLNHYPAVRLNQIRWNPNCNSYTYYAIGYQAGFVRVRVLRT